MKRLGSKRKEEKKKRRNQLFVVIVLASILLASIFGYALGGGRSSEENEITYNGYEFIEEDGFWFTETGNFEFSFRYNPEEIEQIDSELNLLENYYAKPLYISSDYPEATYEIASNLDLITLRIQPACLNESDCEGDLPLKTCEDNFIIIEEKNQTNIIQDNNCVFIQGPQENLTMISDEFLFHILGVR